MSQVSVIIPTRDRWPLLVRAVRSALSQRSVSVEVIVVDDGSTTPAPAEQILSDPRVRLIRHGQARGAGSARNTGVELASADWLAWLDDDDLWAPCKLSRQLAVRSTPETALVYAAAVVVDEDLRPLELWPAPPPEELARALVAEVQLPAGSSNVLARRSAVIACGGFDDDLDHLADWDMWLRLAREGPAARCEEMLVAYVVHGANRHLRAGGLMEEFDRVSRKHAVWACTVGASFDRARFSKYPVRLLVERGQRWEALALAAKCCLRPPTRGNLLIAASGLAGPQAVRRYRTLTRRGVSPPRGPAWLADVRLVPGTD